MPHGERDLAVLELFILEDPEVHYQLVFNCLILHWRTYQLFRNTRRTVDAMFNKIHAPSTSFVRKFFTGSFCGSFLISLSPSSDNSPVLAISISSSRVVAEVMIAFFDVGRPHGRRLR